MPETFNLGSYRPTVLQLGESSKNSSIVSFDELEIFTSVTSIAQSCFEDCTSLARISFHNGITSVGYNSFKNTTSLAIDISFPDLETLNSAFTNSGIISVSNLGKITQLVGVDNNNATFLNCKSLQEVVVPETVTSIGRATFKGCTALTDINFPTGITAIAENALNGCTSLVIDDLSLPNLASLGSNTFYDVSIRKISNLGKITALPTALSSNKNYGKKDVLEEIVIPSGVTEIPNHSFNGYTKLSNVTITGEVATIGTLSFLGCSSLTTITLPSTVTSIGNNAFQNTGLLTFVCKAETPPTLGDKAFTNVSTNCLFYVPDNSVTAYKEATNWSAYADRILPLSEYAE